MGYYANRPYSDCSQRGISMFLKKFVKSVLKVLPEIMVLLSSMSYIIIRLVADINKVSLPTWFDNFNIPTVALFMMVFILLYRSKEKKNR